MTVWNKVGLSFMEAIGVNSRQRSKNSSKPSASKPYWPHPLPEAERIARCGMRPLTLAERPIFPEG